MEVDRRLKILEEAKEFARELEETLEPTEDLNPDKPITFISVGGGELGDLVVTAAKRHLGGEKGGIRTVVFDRYEGFPAQDMADSYEVFDLLNGDLLETAIRKHVPSPSKPHAIYLEIERVNTLRIFEMGVKEGYRIVSTPYGPLIFMDRHLTKLLIDKLGLPRVEWRYASSEGELRGVVRDLGYPVIVKPIMTSSGHGTSIVRSEDELDGVYEYSIKHARGRGDEVIVERYLEELKTEGTEVTQLVVRHFDGRRIISTPLPPIEHKRPGATYHESWMPASISDKAKRKCQEYAVKIADYVGGLGIYAVEQFVIGDAVYNSEVANRPHDTGMITRWMLTLDEGALHLYSSIGLPISPKWIRIRHKDVFGVAHVILAPKVARSGAMVVSWGIADVVRWASLRDYDFDLWYFGKPLAYPERRMGLAVGFHQDLEEARKIAEAVAHFAEKAIKYR